MAKSNIQEPIQFSYERFRLTLYPRPASPDRPSPTLGSLDGGGLRKCLLPSELTGGFRLLSA